jgi:antitoxin component YwqK of YwqJK toxin-antitoxin module
VHGKRHGLEEWFHHNGSQRFRIHHAYGQPIGLYQEWNRGGKLREEVFYLKP